jgi:hypothetical protein
MFKALNLETPLSPVRHILDGRYPIKCLPSFTFAWFSDFRVDSQSPGTTVCRIQAAGGKPAGGKPGGKPAPRQFWPSKSILCY